METLAQPARAHVPSPGDNCAVAATDLAPGETVCTDGLTLRASGHVFEGHRLAIAPIRKGGHLNSWGLPFGVALRAIAPGEPVANANVLEELRHHHPADRLPPAPNFEDRITPFRFDHARFRPAPPLPPIADPPVFMGYPRADGRGTGTRNHLVFVGVSSLAASFAREAAARFAALADNYANVDGIVAVAHTEGAGRSSPNNRDLLLRCLSRFMVHPNVGAVIAIDHGGEAVDNEQLRAYAAKAGLPLDTVPHAWLSLRDGWETALGRAETLVRQLLPQADAQARTPCPFSDLRLALQCGGSDAFSGLSGNPVAARAAAYTVRCGGAANLAETDELIGAESYVLRTVRNAETATAFLGCIARYKAFAARHGHTAEGNPSGGNRLRGLANIVLKSIGAAAKKHPDCRLEGVIPYGAALPAPGFFFMDSPGNDLESVAGQVASGCNLILFITGNGSITNFPFVPTLKIVTTTARYRLLEREMDFNAGTFLEGTPMDALEADLVDHLRRAASGERTKGERAGHHQTQIWRDWPRGETEGGGRKPEVSGRWSEVTHQPSTITHQPSTISYKPSNIARPSFTALHFGEGSPPAADAVGLIIPTSLCAGQVARMVAERLNREAASFGGTYTRFAALPHTEGCGFAGDDLLRLLMRAFASYATHPNTRSALLLEHGCEKTHNAFVREAFATLGADPDRFGWASIQRNGGIEACTGKIREWFAAQARHPPVPRPTGWEHLSLGLLADPGADEAALELLARLAREVLARNGTVLLAGHCHALVQHVVNHTGLLEPSRECGTVPGTARRMEGEGKVVRIAYAEQPSGTGMHIMETHSTHWVEALVGLGASGTRIIVGANGGDLRQGHPMVPVLLLGNADATSSRDADLAPSEGFAALVERVNQTLSRQYTPRTRQTGNLDFQFTRGADGISM
ncbi:MAG: UxaA family hydrolase [Opitutales bacterium]|nr:UxaA family hydrolase [Opitutales bacterium]